MFGQLYFNFLRDCIIQCKPTGTLTGALVSICIFWLEFIEYARGQQLFCITIIRRHCSSARCNRGCNQNESNKQHLYFRNLLMIHLDNDWLLMTVVCWSIPIIEMFQLFINLLTSQNAIWNLRKHLMVNNKRTPETKFCSKWFNFVGFSLQCSHSKGFSVIENRWNFSNFSFQ